MTTPNPASGAVAERPVELIDRLLQLPEQVRLVLGNLLLDSVREGFTSIQEIEQRDKELIRKRVEAYERGEIKATDWREALDRAEKRFRVEHPQ